MQEYKRKEKNIKAYRYKEKCESCLIGLPMEIENRLYIGVSNRKVLISQGYDNFQSYTELKNGDYIFLSEDGCVGILKDHELREGYDIAK